MVAFARLLRRRSRLLVQQESGRDGNGKDQKKRKGRRAATALPRVDIKKKASDTEPRVQEVLAATVQDLTGDLFIELMMYMGRTVGWMVEKEEEDQNEEGVENGGHTAEGTF